MDCTSRENEMNTSETVLKGLMGTIQYNAKAEIVLCETHCIGFTNIWAIRAHLREKHSCDKISNSNIRAVTLGRSDTFRASLMRYASENTNLERIPKCLGGHQGLSTYAKKYHGEGIAENRGEILSAIPGLEVKDGKQCNICSFCAVVDGIMVSHMQKNHGMSHSDAQNVVRCSPVLSVQTIKQHRARYFPVSVSAPQVNNDSGENIGKNSSLQATDQIRNDANSATDLGVMAESVQLQEKRISSALGNANKNLAGYSTVRRNVPTSNAHFKPGDLLPSIVKEIHSFHPSSTWTSEEKNVEMKKAPDCDDTNVDMSAQEESSFLRRSCYSLILAEMAISDLSLAPVWLIELPPRRSLKNTDNPENSIWKLGEYETKISDHVENYLRKGTHLTLSSAPFVRKLVRPTEDKDISSRSPFTPVTTAKTIRNYALSVSRLILFLLRLTNILGTDASSAKEHNAVKESDVEVTKVRSAACRWIPQEMRRKAHVYSSVWMKFCSDSKISNSPPHSSAKAEQISWRSGQTVWNDLDTALHALLREVLLELHEETCSAEPFIIRKFIALLSVQSESKSERIRFKLAHELSPLLAALQYITSTTSLIELRSPELFTHIPIYKENSCNETITKDSYKPYTRSRVEKALNLRSNCSISYVRDFLDICMSVLKVDTSRTRYLPCSKHPKCGLIDGKELSLMRLAIIVDNIHNDAERVLLNEILFGMPLPAHFDEKMSRVHDNFMECRAGFNFLSARRNMYWMLELSSELMKYIWSSEALYNQWFETRSSTDSNSISEGDSTLSCFIDPCLRRSNSIPKDRVDDHKKKGPSDETLIRRTNATEWLSKAQGLQNSLLFLCHIMGGGAARATEIETYQCENGPNSLRNIYVSQGEIIIIARYNKTSSMSGHDRVIARFLDKRTSRLFLLYLSLIKPLEVWLINIMHGESRARDHAKFMFVDTGISFDERKIRSVIQTTFANHKVAFNFMEYRHYQSAMAERFMSSQFVRGLYEDDNFSSPSQYYSANRSMVAHNQAGHSVQTASRVYGTGSHSLQGISTFQLSQYRDASRSWWNLLLSSKEQVDPAVPCTATVAVAGEEIRKPEINVEGAQKGRNVQLLQAKDFRKILSEEIRTGFADDLCEKRKACFEPDTQETDETEKLGSKPGDSRARDSKRKRLGSHQTSTVPIATDRKISGDNVKLVHRKDILRDWRNVLPALKAMRRNSRATFKSCTQLKAIAEALDRRDDILVVMPTGSGKSDVFLLPSFMEAGKRVTILILPLVALVADVQARCSSMGISVGTWNTRATPGIQILIVAVEHTTLPQYETLLMELSNADRLSRIVVDEAHLTLLWSTFREPLWNLSRTLCPVQYPVQKILLSATVPPDQEGLIAKAHGIDEIMVLREPTVSRNLSYRVITSIRSSFESELQSLLKNGIVVLKAEIDRLSALTSSDIRRHQIIVYCPMRRTVEDFYSLLCTEGCFEEKSVWMYHAGLSEEERTKVHKEWLSFCSVSESTNHMFQVVIATSAFGTGVDSMNVRSVIHIGYSRSILEYIQESGRAGRDGRFATCTLVYSRKYAEYNVVMVNNSSADSVVKDLVSTAPERSSRSNVDSAVLLRIFQSWAETKSVCRRQSLFATMDDEVPEPCMFCCLEREMWCDVCQNVDSTEMPYHEQEASNDLSKEFGCTKASPGLDVDASALEQERNPERSMLTAQNSSTIRNCIRQLGNREESASAMESFRLKCLSLLGKCMLCLAVKGETHEAGSSSRNICMRFKCLRCFQEGHDYKNCPVFSANGCVSKTVENGCYACGMRTFRGRGIHEKGEYGSNRRCPWLPALQFAMKKLSEPGFQTCVRGYIESVEGYESARRFANIVQEEQLYPALYRWLVSESFSGTKLNIMSIIEIAKI